MKNFVRIFSKPQYLLSALLIAFVVFSLSILFPNRALIFKVVLSDSSTFTSKIRLILSMYGSIGTNFSKFSATYTSLVAILFGVNTAMMVYYIKKQQNVFKGTKVLLGTGLGGLISGFLGIGCAACGTFVFTTLLSLIGVGAVTTFLPLGGKEFGIIAVGLLLFSIYRIDKKISAPLVCNT